MTDKQISDIDLLSTTDAAVWAKAFCGIATSLGHLDIDEGWMIGWFANAMAAQEMRMNADRLRDEGEVLNVVALKERLAQAEELLRSTEALLRATTCSTGVCCCGDDIDDHHFTSSHGAVDSGERAASQLEEAIVSYFEPPSPVKCQPETYADLRGRAGLGETP